MSLEVGIFFHSMAAVIKYHTSSSLVFLADRHPGGGGGGGGKMVNRKNSKNLFQVKKKIWEK